MTDQLQEAPIATHADTITQSMFDASIGAGYLKFCDCPPAHTENHITETNYQLLCDLDEDKNHVTGLEILGYRHDGFKKEDLAYDLGFTSLSPQQKQEVLNKFLRK